MSRPAWAEAWLGWLRSQALPVPWLQVTIGRDARGWHLAPHGAAEATRPVELAELPALARYTATLSYRSLPYAPDLVGGWVASALDEGDVVTAVEALYPGGLAAWHAERDGSLRVVDWPEVQRRQTGWQGLVKRVEPGDVEAAAQCFCHDGCCLRRVLWRVADEPPVGGQGAVPCYEPCNLFVGFAKQIATLRRGEPSGGGDEARWQAWLARRGARDIAGEVAAEE